MSRNTLEIIIIAIVALHILVGFGLLLAALIRNMKQSKHLRIGVLVFVVLLLVIWNPLQRERVLTQDRDNIAEIQVVKAASDTMLVVLTTVEQAQMEEVIDKLEYIPYRKANPHSELEFTGCYGIRFCYADGSMDCIMEDWFLHDPADDEAQQRHSRLFDEDVFEPVLDLCLEQRSITEQTEYRLWKPEEEIVSVEVWKYDNQEYGRYQNDAAEYDTLLDDLQQLPYSTCDADALWWQLRGWGLRVIYEDGTYECIAANGHMLVDGTWYSSENWGKFDAAAFETLVKSYADEWEWAPLSRVDSQSRDRE